MTTATQQAKPKATLKRRIWTGTQRVIEAAFLPFGLRVKVDFSSPIAYFFLDSPTKALFRRVAHAEVSTHLPPPDAALLEVVEPAWKVLEIGCGTGRLLRHIAPRVAALHGVDTSRLSLRIARRTLKGRANVRFYRGNGQNLRRFQDGSYDMVYTRGVLYHMEREDAYQVMRESARLVKRGGMVSHDFRLLGQRLDQFVDYSLRGDRTFTRPRYFTQEETTLLFQSLGLAVERVVIDPTGQSDMAVFARKT